MTVLKEPLVQMEWADVFYCEKSKLAHPEDIQKGTFSL